MENILIGAHAALGEIGVFAFIWVFVEVLNNTKKSLSRASIAARIGTFFMIASWIVGGYYYLKYYGPDVKPLIKEGPMPWAHSIITESKEHIFLFLPFMAILVTGLIENFNTKIRKNILILSLLIILIGLSMAGLGFMISVGAKVAS